MDVIDEIIQREGKDTNDPDDSGGLTRFGIAQNKNPSVNVATLTYLGARAVYEQKYIIAPGFLKIGFKPLRNQLVDFGVNAGPKTSIKALQKLLKVLVDGLLGPETLRKLSLFDPKHLNNQLVDLRVAFYKKLAERDPRKQKFLQGWLNRAESFRLT